MADDRTYAAVIDLTKSLTEHRVEFARHAGQSDERLSRVEEDVSGLRLQVDSMRPKLQSLTDADATGRTQLHMPLPSSGDVSKARWTAIAKYAPYVGPTLTAILMGAAVAHGCASTPVPVPVPLPVPSPGHP